jgi:hypothetical protein
MTPAATVDNTALNDDFANLTDTTIRIRDLLNEITGDVPPWQPAALHRVLISELNARVYQCHGRALQLLRDGNATIEHLAHDAKQPQDAEDAVSAAREAFKQDLRDTMDGYMEQQCQTIHQTIEDKLALEAEVAALKQVMKQKDEVGISNTARKQLDAQVDQTMQAENRNAHTWDQASQASIKPPLDLLANLRLLSLACACLIS